MGVKQYEESFAAILPIVGADFVLADSTASNTPNTLAPAMLALDKLVLATAYEVRRRIRWFIFDVLHRNQTIVRSKVSLQ